MESRWDKSARDDKSVRDRGAKGSCWAGKLAEGLGRRSVGRTMLAEENKVRISRRQMGEEEK